jgi:hypothetical protein
MLDGEGSEQNDFVIPAKSTISRPNHDAFFFSLVREGICHISVRCISRLQRNRGSWDYIETP